MIKERKFLNVKCDHCGLLLDEENWYDDKDAIDFMLHENHWKELGGSHYCDSCWSYDDDDNIVTKDGRKFTEDGNEIVQRKLSYLTDINDGMTLTQFQTELINAHILFHSMVGTLYKGILADDLCVAEDWFSELLTKRKGTWEWECYHAFKRNNVFKLMADGCLERNYNVCRKQ